MDTWKNNAFERMDKLEQLQESNKFKEIEPLIAPEKKEPREKDDHGLLCFCDECYEDDWQWAVYLSFIDLF